MHLQGSWCLRHVGSISLGRIRLLDHWRQRHHSHFKCQEPLTQWQCVNTNRPESPWLIFCRFGGWIYCPQKRYTFSTYSILLSKVLAVKWLLMLCIKHDLLCSVFKCCVLNFDLSNFLLGLSCWLNKGQLVKRRNDCGVRFRSSKKTSSVEQGRSCNEKIASQWRVLMLLTSRQRQSCGSWRLW